VLLFIFFFIWLRGTLPRLRYDQFMRLGWKVLIPAAIAWLLMVATVRALNTEYTFDTAGASLRWRRRGRALALTFVWDLVAAAGSRRSRRGGGRVRPDGRRHPVPPLPGQQLPALTRSAPATTGVDEPTDGRTTGDRLPDPAQGVRRDLRTMFKKVVTEQYPTEKKPTEPRFHGRHVLNRHPDGLESASAASCAPGPAPADAIYVEGADNTEGERFSPGRALRPRLPDQLPALHLLRPVHRGLPDPAP
jgi:NADH-quinone oxidoreductase subunit H